MLTSDISRSKHISPLNVIQTGSDKTKPDLQVQLSSSFSSKTNQSFQNSCIQMIEINEK